MTYFEQREPFDRHERAARLRKRVGDIWASTVAVVGVLLIALFFVGILATTCEDNRSRGCKADPEVCADVEPPEPDF